MAETLPVMHTPPERFNSLPDWPYQPHYLRHGDLRMAYVDERSAGNSKREEEVILCIHGQPTWSYLYRRMIPVFLTYTKSSSDSRPARRVVAPDLLGFGRSDKPTDDSQYTFNFHRNALLHFVETLDLRNITLVVQDWGGILGLTLPIACPWRFKRFIVMNTTLATGQRPSEGFLQWRAYNNRTPDMDIAALMKRGCPHLSQAEAEAYNAPFPNKEYKAGVRRFPNLVMVEPEMEGADISQKCVEMYSTSDRWKQEDVFMACGMQDMVIGSPTMKSLAKMWKNGCNYMEVQEAGHFTQEWGDVVAERAFEVFYGDTRVEGVKVVQPTSSRL